MWPVRVWICAAYPGQDKDEHDVCPFVKTPCAEHHGFFLFSSFVLGRSLEVLVVEQKNVLKFERGSKKKKKKKTK